MAEELEYGAGNYTLLTEQWSKPKYARQNGGYRVLPERIIGYTQYKKGDTVEITDEDLFEDPQYAKLLVETNSLAPEDAVKAKVARGELERGIVPEDATAEELRRRAEVMMAEAERQEGLRADSQKQDEHADASNVPDDSVEEQQQPKAQEAEGSTSGRSTRGRGRRSQG